MNTREMTDKLQDWQKRAGDSAKQVGQATDHYIRENTWTSMAIAALVGCVLGFLLSHRRD